jgi:hypothetical protein
MNDYSVVIISVSVIVLCWAVVRLNQKLDESIRKSRPANGLDPWADGPSEPAAVAGNKSASPHV